MSGIGRTLVALSAASLLLTGGTPVVAAPAVPPSPDTREGCLGPPQSVEADVPWAQTRLGFERAWPLSRGAGITVAVVDTGIAADSPQLHGRVLRGIDLTKDGGRPADTDCFGHGTFIAGIIAATPANGTGFSGVAPQVTLLPVRVAESLDDGTAGLLAQGIRTAVDAGASVINVSASTGGPEDSLVEAVDYAEEHDVVVVAAAANGAKEKRASAYPAALPTVLAVGAIDSAGNLADFSQQGKHLRLAAPGVDVVSLGPGGPGHWTGSGTSYAVPFVVGAAALVRSYRPNLTAAQVRHRLEVTADHPAAEIPDPGFGWGVVNPSSAVSSVLPEETAAREVVVPDSAGRPQLAPPDPIGPYLAAFGALFAIMSLGAVVVVARLLPAGHRRRWRPARVAVSSRQQPRP